MSIDSATIARIRSALLSWFAANARDLPWRRTRDPYHILVSEIMLQQTQVERVIPKYEAFLAAFPTLEALADAPTAEVIRHWAGLGYNRRAVNLQRTARAVLAEYSGVFPQAPDDLRTLPGIGPYTAGAVACFAFERDVAFIDTNIRRVLRRALVGPENTDPPSSERELLELGAQLVPTGQGWAWNQAIMELGALICTSAAPSCGRCPLRDDCCAYAIWRGQESQAIMFDESYRPPIRPMRRAAEKREESYANSKRFYRGRIIAELRTLPSGEYLALDTLGPQIKPDYGPADESWLRDLIQGLARDGLLVIESDTVRLP
jgi:A/G-specific adenine glycosylase